MNSRLIVLIALSCPSQIGTAVKTRIGAAMRNEKSNGYRLTGNGILAY